MASIFQGLFNRGTAPGWLAIVVTTLPLKSRTMTDELPEPPDT